VVIYMAYFFDPSCPECQRADRDLAYLTSQTPDLVLVRFNIEDTRSKGIAAVLGERLNIPREKRLATPMIVIGQDYLATTDVTLRAMQDLVEKYRQQGGAKPTWEDIRDEEGVIALVKLFEGFSPLAVLGAGLIDGLNPCAFATLIFFVSYLTVTGRKGRDVLLVGGTFTFCVFATYLLIGAGIFTFLKGLGFIPAVARIIYGGTALVCAVFGVLSVYDLYKIRKGQAAEMALQLPGFLKRRTRELIREGSLSAETHGRLGAFVVMAAFAGCGISLLEFVCTGQVYLPTIVFITGVPALAAQGYLYLVLYNLMFVTPLIVVFLLAYFGTNSQQLAAAMNKRLALVKVLTAVLFFALAIWLVSLLVL
jgi:cytochrome c biogenesis protein CcdA